MINIQTLTAELNAHLDAKRTSRKTLAWVAKFWATDVDLGDSAQQIIDRVALLEARMAREHGWAR